MTARLLIDGQKQPKPEPMAPLKLLPVPSLFIPAGEAVDLGPDAGWSAWDSYADTEPAGLVE